MLGLEKTTDEIIESTLASRTKFVRALFERPDSFAKILPYEEYLNEAGMFVLADGSLGAVFEIGLVEHEPLEAECIVNVVEGLKSWFFLPEKCTLQVLFDQAHIPARDPVWNFATSGFKHSHPISEAIYKARLETLKGFSGGKHHLSPMRRKALLSIRYFPERESMKSILRLMERGEGLLFDTMNTMTIEVSEFSQILAQFIDGSKVPLKRLNGADLVDFLRRFFNPKEYLERDFAPFNPHISISEQIVYAGPTGSFEGLEREGLKTRTITLKTSPRRVIPGGMANFLTLNFPFRLSLNFSFPRATKIKSYFDTKEFFLQNSPSARARRQQQELKAIQERLAHDERCLFMTFCVIVEGETEETLNQRTRAITSVFHNDLECEVIKEEMIGFGLCLNSLPLFYTPAADHSSQRFIRIMNKDAAKLLPVFDSYRGMENPLQLYLSRENNLVRFSWAANPISNHTAILGDTGSGKSKYALDCVQAMKLKGPSSVEPLIFVIDKRASCEALCREFDGDLSVFTLNKEMPFSPFRGVFDDAKIQFLTKLILTAVKLTSTSFDLESHHLAIVSRALKEAYLRRVREKGVGFRDGELVEIDSDVEVSVSMDDVIASMSGLTAEDEFESLKEQIEDLIARLMPFYSDGIYAPYFRGQVRKKKANQKLLYAYDLEALDSDETLKVLMSMCVIQEIMATMARPENLKRGGVLYIEELGCLGRDNPIVGDFVVEAAERMRKMGFFLIGVAPNPRVFFETEAGKAVWGGADNFFFLKMSPDNARYLKDNSSLLGPAALEIVTSLETRPNEYAEVFYTNKTGTHQGAFRYIQSHLDRASSVNSERDKAALEEASPSR
ncbi:MAG: TraC family protein [Bdellovibrionales bacterium]